MRIVHVSPWFSPHLGGVESHVLSLSRELVVRGHDVTVVTTRHDRAIPEDEVVDGVRVLRVRPRGVVLRTPIVPALVGVVRGLPADIIHAHAPPPLSAYYASSAAKSSGTPFVVTNYCDVEIPTPFGAFIESFYRRTFGAATLRRASKVVVLTRTYGATSRAVWKYDPSIIPAAVDPQRFRPDVDGSGVRTALGIPAERPLVLLVARIVPHKGIEHLIEAARAVPDAAFAIAGAGTHMRAMQRLARDLHVDDRVHFLGRVPEADLPGLYAACDVLVLPSVSRLEAFGVVALEAMATGKPVVLADIPGVREVIEDGREGLLVDPMDPQDIARQVGLLAADPALRTAMGRRGRQKVLSSFSVDVVTAQVIALYESVVAARAPQATTRSETRSPA